MAHLDIRITLHDLFDSRKRQGRMFEIRRILLRTPHLLLPELPEVILQQRSGIVRRVQHAPMRLVDVAAYEFELLLVTS